MLIGFSSHTRDGRAAVQYLVRGGAVNYVTGERNGHGGARSCPPEILRGDPAVTEAIIRLSEHRHTYSSAVLSWHPDDRPTEEQIRYSMDEFERIAFAGLERGKDYDAVWVRHNDADHVHVHVVTPRVHLQSGRYLNICPPGSRGAYDLLRSKLGAEFGWADPSDPGRTQLVRLPHHIARLQAKERRERGVSRQDIRQLAANHVLAKARAGLVKTREDAVRALREAGLTVTRERERSVTIAHPETGMPVRLKGALFDRERFAVEKVEPLRPGRDQARFEALSRQLEEVRAARERFNRERYLRAEPQATRSLPRIAAERVEEATHDRTGTASRSGGEGIARRVVEGRRDLDRAVGGFGRASPQLEQSNASLGRAAQSLEWRLAGQERRAVNEGIFAKYGIPQPTLATAGLERDATERELCDEL